MSSSSAESGAHPATVPWRAPPRPDVALFGEALIDEFAALRVVGGAPFNAACALARFNCAPLLISAVGCDPAGDMVRARMVRFGLSVNGLQQNFSRPTGRVMIEQAGLDHRFTILPDQAYDAIALMPALNALRCAPPQMVYFGTLAQRGVTSWQTLQQLLSATTARRFLDLNLRTGQVERAIVLSAVDHADVLKVNREELQILAAWAFGDVIDKSADTVDTDTRVARLMQAFSLSEMIVTDGAQGWSHASRDGAVLHGTAIKASHVIDTVGAGDAFSAIYLVGQLHRWSLALTLQRAAEFAAAICQIRGAVASTPEFYDSWRARWFDVTGDSVTGATFSADGANP